jgi:hypothetical protein
MDRIFPITYAAASWVVKNAEICSALISDPTICAAMLQHMHLGRAHRLKSCQNPITSFESFDDSAVSMENK